MSGESEWQRTSLAVRLTRARRLSIAAFIVSCGGAAVPAGSSDGYRSTQSSETAASLTLTVSKSLDIEATLENRFTDALIVLADDDLQPVELSLIDSSGTAHPPFDERSRRKFDRSVTEPMFSTIPPSGTKRIESGTFRANDDGTYELTWGPYEFTGLRAGQWTARAELRSDIDEVTAREGGRSRKVPGVWKGRARSNSIEISLPDATHAPSGAGSSQPSAPDTASLQTPQPAPSVTPVRMSPAARIAMGIEASVSENTDYAVEGSALRVRLHDAMRATPLQGGHVWAGRLVACERTECTELSLSGPGTSPVGWHGYRFELLFVTPTRIRVTTWHP